MASDFEWTEEAIARLRTFWNEGHSTAAIGRCMNTSKNAVVGKAHRLGLPSRPSPIRGKDSTPRLPAPARTLSPSRSPPRPVAGSLPPKRPPRPPAAPQTPPTRADPPPPAPALAKPEKPVLPRPALRQPCCWPIGHPSEIAQRFARAGSASGSATPTRCHASLTAPSTRGSPTSNPRPQLRPVAAARADPHAMTA